MIKAVLFDLDNTLVDFMTMKELSSKAAIRAMIDAGLESNRGEKQSLKKLFDMYETIGFEDQKIFNKFITEVHGTLDYKILAAGIAAYRKVKIGQITPFPHSRQTLLKLRDKGLILGIVSDAPRLQAWLRLAELNFMEFFNVVVTFDDSGKFKPNKEPFEIAITKLKIKPEEILFVGDNPKRDIAGAKEVGMKTVLAKYGQLFTSDTVKADYEIEDITKLLEIVEN